MNEQGSNDGAKPAKASNPKRRYPFGQVPPHVRERLDQEARVLRSRMGIPLPTPAEVQRSLTAARLRFVKRDDEPIPF
jgi:hypothetical protein